MDNPKELTHISLCAGYGGIDLGLKRAIKHVRTICFSEIEAFAIANLVSKMEQGYLDAAPIWTDLKTLPWESFKGKVDILSGGFPCQPFSAAGRRAGDSDPRHLWPYIVRGIQQLGNPPIVFFENVEGIISSKLKGEGWSDPQGTPVLLHILRELERLGYYATASIFSASEVGAPHQRKRVFILGVSTDLNSTGWDLVSELIKTAQAERAKIISANSEFKLSTSKDPFQFTDAWPAGRGAHQYFWEPPRVTPKSEGRKKAKLSVSELGDSNSSRSSEDQRESFEQGANGVEQRSYVAPTSELGDSNNEGLQGCNLDEANTPDERWDRESELDSNSSIDDCSVSRSTQPSLGGEHHGSSDWLDYAKLCTSVDSRTDELRLLGNGVVPATAERAFITLWTDLKTTIHKD